MNVLNRFIFVLMILKQIELLVCENIGDVPQIDTIGSQEIGNDRLICANVISRHGQRNMWNVTYPTDPYKNESYYPGGSYELTNVGKQQANKLGKYLRERYGAIIGPTYSDEKVFVRSLVISRVLMSAEYIVDGLFSPTNDDALNNERQPIPIHTANSEYLLSSFAECPQFDHRFRKLYESQEIKSLLNQHRSLINFIETNAKLKLTNPSEVLAIFVILCMQKELGLALPEWANTALSNDAFEHISAASLAYVTHSVEMKKIRAGFLIKEMLDHFKNKTQSLLQPDRSLWIYSTRATTLANVLNSLHLFDFHMSPVASSIHMELYQRGAEYYVQIFYRKSDTEIVMPLMIPNCGTKCPLDKMFELYEDILPTPSESFESLCRIN